MKKLIIATLSLVLSLAPLAQAQQSVNQEKIKQISSQDLEVLSQAVEQLPEEQKEALEKVLESKDAAPILSAMIPLGIIAVTVIIGTVANHYLDPEKLEQVTNDMTENQVFS